MPTTLTVDTHGIKEARSRISSIKRAAQAGPRKVAHAVGDLVEERLRSEAPGSGHLRGSIAYRVTAKAEVMQLRFRAAWYAKFRTGTKPHDIWAGFYTGKSDKRWLFFSAGGGVSHVHHPGARPNDWVKRAYDSSLGAIHDLVVTTGRGILGK